MNKQEAANFLGISLRALERHTAEHRVAARYEKGKTRSVLAYDQSELERFKARIFGGIKIETSQRIHNQWMWRAKRISST